MWGWWQVFSSASPFLDIFFVLLTLFKNLRKHKWKFYCQLTQMVIRYTFCPLPFFLSVRQISNRSMVDVPESSLHTLRYVHCSFMIRSHRQRNNTAGRSLSFCRGFKWNKKNHKDMGVCRPVSASGQACGIWVLVRLPLTCVRDQSLHGTLQLLDSSLSEPLLATTRASLLVLVYLCCSNGCRWQ